MTLAIGHKVPPVHYQGRCLRFRCADGKSIGAWRCTTRANCRGKCSWHKGFAEVNYVAPWHEGYLQSSQAESLDTELTRLARGYFTKLAVSCENKKVENNLKLRLRQYRDAVKQIHKRMEGKQIHKRVEDGEEIKVTGAQTEQRGDHVNQRGWK